MTSKYVDPFHDLAPGAGVPPRRPGRPFKVAYERRIQFTLSLTPREHWVLERMAEHESYERKRRIWKGELVAVLLFRTSPDLYNRFSQEYDDELAKRRPLPLTEEELLAHEAQYETDRVAYLKANGLPDMRAFYDRHGVPDSERRFKD